MTLYAIARILIKFFNSLKASSDPATSRAAGEAAKDLETLRKVGTM